ncbi:MAG TPA: AroM family protein [Stellaceae bacterium]|nr:AroM family protein [Stellaceae bacterium]
MREVLGTLTIGQAPRPDVTPIIDRFVPERVRRIHRGVLDRLSYGEIERRYLAEAGEAALVTRLQDGRVVDLSRERVQEGAQEAVYSLDKDGCDVILILCTGTFEGLRSGRAWLVEPDRVIPPLVAGLLGRRQLGVIVPIASQIETEREKWRPLAGAPLFDTASPYSDGPETLLATGERLRTQGAEAVLLDCIGFTERHRAALTPLGVPVLLSNAIAAKAVAELFGG